MNNIERLSVLLALLLAGCGIDDGLASLGAALVTEQAGSRCMGARAGDTVVLDYEGSGRSISLLLDLGLSSTADTRNLRFDPVCHVVDPQLSWDCQVSNEATCAGNSADGPELLSESLRLDLREGRGTSVVCDVHGACTAYRVNVIIQEGP